MLRLGRGKLCGRHPCSLNDILTAADLQRDADPPAMKCWLRSTSGASDSAGAARTCPLQSAITTTSHKPPPRQRPPPCDLEVSALPSWTGRGRMGITPFPDDYGFAAEPIPEVLSAADPGAISESTALTGGQWGSPAAEGRVEVRRLPAMRSGGPGRGEALW
jgi:hypothetical protein